VRARQGSGFVLLGRYEKRLPELISHPATDPELASLQSLGWHHSHVRSQIFLFERNRFPLFCRPILDCSGIRRGSDSLGRADFFFREPSGEMRSESSYQKSIIDIPPPNSTRT
jgi:hypothetical protein